MIDDGLVRIRPQAELLYVSQGRAVLAMRRDGSLQPDPNVGFFVHETRVLSRHQFLLDGAPWTPVALSNVGQHTWLGYYVGAPRGLRRSRTDPRSEAVRPTIELRIARFVGGGFHEHADITSFSLRPLALRFELALDGDFADLEETREGRRQRGRLRRSWEAEDDGGRLTFDYHARGPTTQRRAPRPEIHRVLRVQIGRCGSQPRWSGGRLRFDVALAPRATWHACLDYVAEIEGVAPTPSDGCRDFADTDDERDRRRRLFLGSATRIASRESETLAPVVIASLERAKRDLAGLRLDDLDRNEREWTMAAGLPLYVALFGRDTLTASWQAALLGPEMMQGTLDVMARHQAREVDDWRDAQPGRMLHEAHTGPLAALGLNPRSRYYGSVTASSFYAVVLSELWHWTGDAERVRALLPAALAGLRWLDTYSDRDGDGFYDYQTRSSQGLANQGWKDSGDAIVREDGSIVNAPIATCEEQGFAYVAKLHMAEVLWWLGDKHEARRLHHEAAELKRRFDDAFWMDDHGFLAMALGPQRERIASIGSNAGHCLATGIVAPERAARIVGRLLEPELFTGWGIRTLSARHPAYDPYSYHRGSVWPVEQGSFALGFMRYGFHDAVERICRAQFEAARFFEHHRLPEVMSGHPRDAEHPFPALYPQTNAPQAWSCSTVFALLQALLGLYPYAPLHLLLVDPWLPEWLPELRLEGLRVGRGVVSLRFWRTGTTTDYEVLEARGALHVVRQPSPWSLTAGLGERFRDALSSLLPGH